MNLNYQKICSELLKNLPQRTTNVIERRFGLRIPNQNKLATGQAEERETLEAIGKSYGITRERIRQIENEGFSQIKPKTENYQKVFQYFNDVLESLGGLKKEETLLSFLGGERHQNQISFLLTLGEDFQRFSEDKDFYSFWTRKKESVNLAKKVIDLTLNKFNKKSTPLTLDELFRIQKTGLSKILVKGLNKNIFYSYLEISKKIEENPEGRIGLKEWVEINPRGIKDRAYLVLKKEEKPLHFTKVAVLIENLPYSYSKKTHTATVHNELIKDPRFVLVGRGLYALQEWGYTPGVVKDIILETLKKAKRPLLKEKILKKVLEQRIVKENTVFLNLQDKSYFSKNSQGKYTLNEDIKEA